MPNLVDRALAGRSRAFVVGTAMAAVALLGGVNSLIASEVSFSFFYLAPVTVAAWYAGRAQGITLGLLSALVWLAATYLPGPMELPLWIPVWNASLRAGFLLVVAFLVSELRITLDRERALARVDRLTGLLNSRAFLEAAGDERARAERYAHAFTLAYLDADNFKVVNDRWGHAEGDRVLETMGTTLRTQLRKVDVAARMGGDEFAVLLPETGMPQANQALAKLVAALDASMLTHGWPVTFSVGAVVCATSPPGLDTLLARADEAMYSAKRAGKNQVAITSTDSEHRSQEGPQR